MIPITELSTEMIPEKWPGGMYRYKTPLGELKEVRRLAVPQEKVAWSVPWDEYDPVDFTADHVKEAVWADPDIGEEGFVPKWNTLDGNVSGQTVMSNTVILPSPLRSVIKTSSITKLKLEGYQTISFPSPLFGNTRKVFTAPASV